MQLAEIVPAPFYPLFTPQTWRYKVFHGGRGGAKSKSAARVAVTLADMVKLDVLYGREFQNSIEDSSHRDLVNEIMELGLEHRYDIGKQQIRNLVTGSVFKFIGLRHNLQSIKSKSNFDLCVVEEAESVSEDSWETLDPTIRKPHSEIWVIFNAKDPDGATYKRFVKTPPPDAYVRKINFDENPYFPDVLRKQMEHCRATDADKYDHVWLGNPKVASDAQILRGKWVIDEFEPGTNWQGPFFGADWGFSQDPTVLIKAWVFDNTLYVEHEAYGVGVDIDLLPAMFAKIEGSNQHVIRADCARPETISHMVRHGYPRLKGCKKWTGCVEDGVEHLRGYQRIVIHPRCKHTQEEARLYSYKTLKGTDDVLPQIIDANNHCMDALRYGLEPLIKLRKSGVDNLRI